MGGGPAVSQPVAPQPPASLKGGVRRPSGVDAGGGPGRPTPFDFSALFSNPTLRALFSQFAGGSPYNPFPFLTEPTAGQIDIGVLPPELQAAIQMSGVGVLPPVLEAEVAKTQAVTGRERDQSGVSKPIGPARAPDAFTQQARLDEGDVVPSAPAAPDEYTQQGRLTE